MTTNGTTAPTRPAAMSNEILADAARRMLPVLAGKVLTAVADRAVEKVDELADRLSERTGGGQASTDADADESPSRAGAAVAFLMEQARLFLAFVARLAAQALEMLRRATEMLRSRRAPEGIDEAPEPEQISAPEDLEDEYEDDDLEGEYEDEYEDEDDVDADADADTDADTEERVTARA